MARWCRQPATNLPVRVNSFAGKARRPAPPGDPRRPFSSTKIQGCFPASLPLHFRCTMPKIRYSSLQFRCTVPKIRCSFVAVSLHGPENTLQFRCTVTKIRCTSLHHAENRLQFVAVSLHRHENRLHLVETPCVVQCNATNKWTSLGQGLLG